MSFLRETRQDGLVILIPGAEVNNLDTWLLEIIVSRGVQHVHRSICSLMVRPLLGVVQFIQAVEDSMNM